MNEPIPIPFHIEPSSGTPIFRQIVEQITRFVMSGNLKPGTELPSVRQVAAQLEVNPMTISRAYSILESDGVLERLRGIGMIVAKSNDIMKREENRIELLKPALEEAARQGKQLALPHDLIYKTFRKIMEE